MSAKIESTFDLPDLPKVISLQLPVAKFHDIKLRGIKISMLDISSMHAQASGNKLFKLAPNINTAIQQGYSHVLSFGGAYSNHIHALASYATEKGLSTIGIIRGESKYASNPTLKAAQQSGMQFHFVDRKTYRLRHDPDYLAELAKQYPQAYIIPEGGSNQHAVEGCMQLAKILNQQMGEYVDSVAVACGTGGTLAGLVRGLQQKQQVIGFPVVRDGSLSERIKTLLSDTQSTQANYRLIAADYGGYAKFDKTHLDFILDWLEQTGILLDPVYTSKMCRRLLQCIEDGELQEVDHICLIHTGGLQAWHGMHERVIKFGGEQAWRKIVLRLRSGSL